MKRVRIMLMAICLVAVAGGVLAFKAMTPVRYCTIAAATTVAGGPLTCPVNITCPFLRRGTLFTTTTATTGAVICSTFAEDDDTPCLQGEGVPVKKCANVKATITGE